MKANESKNILIGSLSAIGCEVLFGLSYLFTKQATAIASPLVILGWRFLTAFIMMTLLAWLGVIKLTLKGKLSKSLLLIALFSPVLYYLGETFGISYTTSSESGVFLASIPVVSLLASSIFLKHRPKKGQVLGILTTLIGVLMTVLAVSGSSRFSLIGYAFLYLAVISYALYTVLVEKNNQYSETEITYAMLLAGTVFFVPLAFGQALFNGQVVELLKLPFQEATVLLAVLYQGIACSILAFFLSNLAIAKIGVNQTASFIGVSTVVSILSGALLLHEEVNLVQIIGAVIIILGVYIANLNPKLKQLEETYETSKH